MKKVLTLSLCGMLVLGSCGTGSHAEQGASNGAIFGAIFGSAIGGIMAGPRGSDIGSMFGMISGAAIGASVGAKADRYEIARMERRRAARERRAGTDASGSDTYDAGVYGNDESGFDPNHGGDDRITFDAAPGGYPDAPSAGDSHSTVQPRTMSVEQLGRMTKGSGIHLNPMIEIRNASFVDADGDGVISRGEQCHVTFDIMNRSSEPLRDIQPIVADATSNPHIHISPSMRVDMIAPKRGMRYTATVSADRRLKDGEVLIKVGVVQGNDGIGSQIKEFRVATRKK